MTFYQIGNEESSMGELREFLIVQVVSLHMANKKKIVYSVAVLFEIITSEKCLQVSVL